MPVRARRLIFAPLLLWRVLNAFTLRTFFQPDEYYQSLEPGLAIAFANSHAWITWEWTTQLRSSLHPILFAAVYQAAAKVAYIANVTLSTRASFLLAAPKLLQATMAALLDLYTHKLALNVYGSDSRAAAFALALTVASPWQWFCSVRTLSNCLETTLTVVALCYWPWHLAGQTDTATTTGRRVGLQFRISLLLAAFACLLRPTNSLIWALLSLPTVWQASGRLRFYFVRETLLCGSVVLCCSIFADRWYYGGWTFPPLRFLYFNIVQSLAIFYGRNRANYYLTEGLPLLLTTALPFAAVGLWQAILPSSLRGPRHARILTRLAWTCLVVTTTLSCISHKEVRFLYPILPLLHVLAASPLATFLAPPSPWRKTLIVLLLTVNLFMAGYASLVHQRGVVDVVVFLRAQHEIRNGLSHIRTRSNPTVGHLSGDMHLPNSTTIAFLTPCHSTPWRSHLLYSDISAWALTCDPPLHVPLSEREVYFDEADVFYQDPVKWLSTNMQSVPRLSSTKPFPGYTEGDLDLNFGSLSERHFEMPRRRRLRKFEGGPQKHSRRSWPMYLVFFAQLEDTMHEFLKSDKYGTVSEEGMVYRECWRGFNSHWHDDWRRRGDVVVWCQPANST